MEGPGYNLRYREGQKDSASRSRLHENHSERRPQNQMLQVGSDEVELAYRQKLWMQHLKSEEVAQAVMKSNVLKPYDYERKLRGFVALMKKEGNNIQFKKGQTWLEAVTFPISVTDYVRNITATMDVYEVSFVRYFSTILRS